MSAHVLLNLLNELGKRDKMRGVPSILSLFRNEFNILNNTGTLIRRVAEIQIFEKTYLIVIKDETGLKFKINDSTLFLIGSYAQNLVALY